MVGVNVGTALSDIDLLAKAISSVIILLIAVKRLLKDTKKAVQEIDEIVNSSEKEQFNQKDKK